jgi:TetR/AcrR family transcriptional regulator, transcriptional repressor for nem operon
MMHVMRNAKHPRINARSAAKEASHERIVSVAARAIRRSGYDGTGVADIMKEAGLTHGAFYAHFASREAMLAEAATRACADAAAVATSAVAQMPADRALGSMLRAYLSREHLEQIELGCPLVALGSETVRQAPEVRRATTRHIKEMIDLVARQSPDWGQPGAHEHALVTLSTMVGALLLARTVDEPALADSLCEAAIKHLAPA